MESLAKSVQQAQAAVLGVQDELALLRTQLEENDTAATTEGCDLAANPYYVELQTSIQQKQEAAAHLLQCSAHLFYEQFSTLEARAARLDNVHAKEKELQSAKKSMQRYFDAHARELADTRDTHAGAMRLELEKRQHVESGAVRVCVLQQQQHLVQHVLLTWMKKAMIRNLTREYVTRQNTTRHTYQAVAADALAQQRLVVQRQRLFGAWRWRLQRRQMRRLEDTAAESERRAQLFRQELATTQATLRDRLGAALQAREQTNIEAPVASSTVAAAGKASVPSLLHPHGVTSEGEVQRLRTALEEVTLEFSERTGTYIRQQEHLEQLFWAKEQKLREAIVHLQAELTQKEAAHRSDMAQQRSLVEQVSTFWAAQQSLYEAAVQRKEEQAHYAVLGLVGRLRHRQRALQDESAKLASEVHTLAPLSERCVRLENQVALAQQLVDKHKEKSRVAEHRAACDRVVSELLADRVLRNDSTVLRHRYFAQWMQRGSSRALVKAEAETAEVKARLLRQRQQLLTQQQETAERHETDVAQLRNDAEQLRRTNVRLQAEVATLVAAQRERDTAYDAIEATNGGLSAALLRSKMERRGLEDKFWCTRANEVVVAESQARCRLEMQAWRWWAVLQQREGSALKVWTAALHHDTAQLTAVCGGWEAHCQGLEAQHTQQEHAAAGRVAAALERAHLQSQTSVRWGQWLAWAMRRRALRSLETRSAQSRSDLIERHRHEVARLHAQHDGELRRLQRELTEEKAQLQGIHRERTETLRGEQAQSEARLTEQHRQQVALLKDAHAAVVEEREEAVRECEARVAQLGSLVVEYCASATFARWRSWARERQTQRGIRQQRGILLRLQQWHTATLCTVEEALDAKTQLFSNVLMQASQAHDNACQHYTQRLAREQELHLTHLRKAERAAFVAEKETAHLREEVQHVRSLYEAEQRSAEAAQATAAEGHQSHRSFLSLSNRVGEWREATQRLALEQQRAIGGAFAEAATALLRDAAIDTEALHETYVDALHGHEATRKALHRTAKEKAHLEEVHRAITERYAALEKARAETSKEAALLTDTLAALVHEHEAVQGELEDVRAQKDTAETSHAALAKEHGAIRSEMAVLKAEAADVQRSFSAYVAEHERVRDDAAVQTEPPRAPSPPPSPSSSSSSPSTVSLRQCSSSSDDVLEVSALNAEDQQQQQQHKRSPSEDETRSATAVMAEGERRRGTTLPSALALPATLTERLRNLEMYTSATTVNEPTHENAATEDTLAHLLQEPFLPAAPTAESTATPPCPAVVLQALETVRRAALRWSATQARRHVAEVKALNTRRAQSEEALVQLRENMEGLLEEQRGLTEELQEDLQQQQQQEQQRQAENTQRASSLFVQERLSALTTRYARVLDAFYSDITSRQDTFYSVNGMLVEVDQFSEALLERFEENVFEMARLKGRLSNVGRAESVQEVGTPPFQSLSADISVMSPEPTHPQQEEESSSFLARVLRETATPPQQQQPPVVEREEDHDAAAVVSPSPSSSAVPSNGKSSTSSSGRGSGAADTPTKRALRDRVHLLERMLVEAKVQIAETSTLMSASRRAASLAALTPPSLQAQLWAAQTAKDFAHLAVTEDDLLALAATAESTMYALVEALRAAEVRVHDAQSEMSQQLQTACVSVEESVRQRYRAEVSRYEATVQSVNEALRETTRQHAAETQRLEQQLEEQRAAMAAAVGQHTEAVQAVRRNFTAEVAELTGHLALLEAELRHTRQTTQAAVQEAVTRQAELLTAEHTHAVRGLEKRVSLLTAEAALREGRAAAAEREAADRLQREREAVARLQRRLEDEEAEAPQAPHSSSVKGNMAAAPLMCTLQGNELLRNINDLFAAQCTAKAEWFAASVAELLEREREGWETEMIHLTERVASLLERTSPLPSTSHDHIDAEMVHDDVAAPPPPPTGSPRKHHPTPLNDTVVEEASSSQALTPSPRRRLARVSTSPCSTQSPLSPSRHATHHRSPPHPAAAARGARQSVASTAGEVHLNFSTGASPTRCRSPSLDSLELSTSLVRYSMMLSEQRTRNTERLERANALTAEVEDLLLRGAELTHRAGTPRGQR